MTGACGFIGQNLVAELLKQGADVIALDLPTANWSIIPKSVRRVPADILDKKSLVGVFDTVNIVYHLAARTDLGGKKLRDYEVNFEGTKNVFIEAAKKSSVERFVFYSTQLVVGLFNEKRFIDENEPYRTNTVYGQSKIEGEKVVKALSNEYGVNYTIIRPTSVYGPAGGAPYKDFFKAIKSGRYFHVGRADNLVSMVYVKNLIDLTILASLHKSAKNKVYYGNDFHPYTMRDFAETAASYYKIQITSLPYALVLLISYIGGILKAVGLNPPIYPFRLKNIMMNYCYDIQNTLAIGYDPKYNLELGVRETLDWYESRK
ncbi:NAD(P)-dependent oxidoreductase [Candidatus Nomurabacteria bacterium]|nr:NAD(P)-dependent oxidoreductase [Candidatus Nomurabacteria bacterium]